ncbi:MAG: hypothetical protein ACPHP1_09285, partial [Miltoncostaeaceae bacterium]
MDDQVVVARAEDTRPFEGVRGLKERGVHLEGVLQAEATDGKDGVDVDLAVGGAVHRCHGVH